MTAKAGHAVTELCVLFVSAMERVAERLPDVLGARARVSFYPGSDACANGLA